MSKKLWRRKLPYAKKADNNKHSCDDDIDVDWINSGNDSHQARL